MADAAQKRLTPEAAAEFLDAIRAKNPSTLRWALINFGADRERFLNTPFAEAGGERTLFLMEAIRTGDPKIVTLLLEGGAKPETRTQGETGKNSFYAENLDINVAGLMLSAMRNRIPGREINSAIHNAIVGEKDQKTDSCLFLQTDRKKADLVLYLLDQLPNGSSRRQALEQCVSPVGYAVDAKAKAETRYFHPGRTLSLLAMIDYSTRGGSGYRSAAGEKAQALHERVEHERDSAFYDEPRAEAGLWVTAQQRDLLENGKAPAVAGLNAEQMRDWLAAGEPATMPPPLAQRFMAVLPGLSGGGGLSQSFNAASGAALTQLQETLESFGSDTKEIVNTPILKADGTRTMLLTEIVNSGNAAALDLILTYGADPARRADGSSGKNSFYAEKLQPAQVAVLAKAVRAPYADAKAADKAVHDAILGAKGQPSPSALIIQVDNGNGAAASALYKSLPNDTSRMHAWEHAFSPLGLKIDGEANARGIYLSIARCFNLSDITGFRYEKLGQSIDYATHQLFDGTGYGYGRAPAGNRSDRDFYYPSPKTDSNYMVSQSMREAEEKRYYELRAKETAQQGSYRDSLEAALAEREEAEQALKGAQQAFQEQERRLKTVGAEVEQLQQQVVRNDETLERLADERGKLRKQLKQFI